MGVGSSLPPVQRVFVALTHLFALISLILVIIWANGDAVEKDTGSKTGYLGGLDWADSDLVFNWHPVLMVAGMVFALTEAVLAYRSLPFSKKVNKSIHLAWQTIAIILLSIGLRAVFKNHQETNKADLWSLHSWLGILVITLFATNYIVGVVTFFFQLASEPVRAEVLPFHVALGTCLYLAAIFTAMSGIVEKLALSGTCTVNYPTGGGVHYGALLGGCKLANGLGITLVLTGLFGVFSITDLAPRDKNAFDDNGKGRLGNPLLNVSEVI